MMSQVKRWFWVVGVGTAVVLAAVWVATTSAPATAEELVEWTLQASDLPHAADWVAQATYLYDVSQPLNKDSMAEATPEEVALLTSYTAAAKSGGLVGEEPMMAYVGHYWYAYDTGRTAQAAADLLLADTFWLANETAEAQFFGLVEALYQK